MDSTLLALVNERWTHPWLDLTMVAMTTIGLLCLALLTVWQLWRGERQLGIALFVAQAATLVGVLLFYWLAARSRPVDARLLISAPPLPSFPSGHAALAATTATVWWLDRGWNRRTLAIVLLAVGVAYSRIYLGHHFPTDVLAGVIWGMGVGAAAHGVTHFGSNRRRMLSWFLWPQVSLALMVTLMAYLGLIPLYLLTWPYADKLLHLLLIGALAFWLNLWLPDWRLQLGRASIPVAVALPFTLAFLEEIMQSWSPLRTFDLGDLASDFVGLLLFFALSQWAVARMARQVVSKGYSQDVLP